MTIEAQCPNCDRTLVVLVETSGGPPKEVKEECPLCGAVTIWPVYWEYKIWLGTP